MRLWHEDLIPYLDNKRLLSQHRECCALRGKGWGRKHSVVDYVFKYDLAHLYAYHLLVIHEMNKRNYSVDGNWYGRLYRGSKLPRSTLLECGTYVQRFGGDHVYVEHDDKYLKECLLRLKEKGACLVNGKSLEQWLVELDLGKDTV